MKALKLALVAENSDVDKKWEEQLSLELKQLVPHVKIVHDNKAKGKETAQFIFIDEARPDAEKLAAKLKKARRVVFLVVSESNSHQVPKLYLEGKVDDFVIFPFRPLEVFSKINLFQKAVSGVKGALQTVQETFQMVERIQKTQLPKRFSQVKGLKVESRYLAGSQNGGDYFDVVELKGQQEVAISLVCANSYKVTAILNRLFSQFIDSKVDQFIFKLIGELAPLLKEETEVHLFYGIISRKNNALRYILLGDVSAYISSADGGMRALTKQGGAIMKGAVPKLDPSLDSQTVELGLQTRLTVASSGFSTALGNEKSVFEMVKKFQVRDSLDLLNELAFKGGFDAEAGKKKMPLRDCTALVIEKTSSVIQLSEKGKNQ